MIERKHKSLGRGLSALLGDLEEEGNLENDSLTKNFLSIEKLQPGKYQPRKVMKEEHISELAASIREKGIIQPIIVRKTKEKFENYEIIAGERRWRAAQVAKLHKVPVIIKDFSDQEALELALIENIQRKDLSPLEEAEGYQRLMDEFGHTQEILAKSISKSRSHVANMIRLLNLPDGIKSLIDSGQISIGHARALLTCKEPLYLAKEIVKRGLNVRATEKLIRDAARPKPQGASHRTDINLLELENRLERVLGLKVKIRAKEEKGSLEVKYANLDQLDHLLKKLGLE